MGKGSSLCFALRGERVAGDAPLTLEMQGKPGAGFTRIEKPVERADRWLRRGPSECRLLHVAAQVHAIPWTTAKHDTERGEMLLEKGRARMKSLPQMIASQV